MVEEGCFDYLCIASHGTVHLTHVRCHSVGSAPLSNVTEEEAAPELQVWTGGRALPQEQLPRHQNRVQPMTSGLQALKTPQQAHEGPHTSASGPGKSALLSTILAHSSRKPGISQTT